MRKFVTAEWQLACVFAIQQAGCLQYFDARRTEITFFQEIECLHHVQLQSLESAWLVCRSAFGQAELTDGFTDAGCLLEHHQRLGRFERGNAGIQITIDATDHALVDQV